ncbi:MAG: hypothetical protein RLZZ488_2760 [Pseudomonadota bacterium]|jgi:uncharacterized protein YeeX (DUF496 family)
MMRSTFRRLTQVPVALTVLGVVGSGCGLRETRSSSATSLLGQVQKASNAGAVTATPKVSVQLDEIRKQLRDATEFWKLSLAQESKERKEADESIRADVLSLSEKLEALRTKLDSEINRLDKTLREEFDGKLKKQETDLVALISNETKARESAISTVNESIRLTRDELEGKISTLDAETKDAILKTNKALSDAEQRVRDLLGAEKENLLSEMKALEGRASKSTAELRSEIKGIIDSNEASAQAKFTDLQGQMVLAKQALEAQRASLTAQINELALKTDATSLALKTELAASSKTLTERIHTLDLVTQSQLAEVKADLEGQTLSVKTHLEQKIINNGEELSYLINLASSQAQANLTKAIGEQNSQLVAVMNEADNALRAELSKKISEESESQAAALQAFKREVDATYAKQVDLIALQGVVNGLSNALNILDHKVDDNDKRLTESVKKLRWELVEKIDGVQANVQSLRGDFTAHVKTYDAKVAELAAETRRAARQLRKEMASAAVHSEAERAKLQASIETLTVKLTNTEDFAIKTRDALTGKIVELERRDSELSNDVRDARNAATADLSAAIAKEQQARQAIADDVKKLQAEVERVSQVAGQALALSKANELAIAGVQTDLKEAEQRWKTELATLRGDMEKEMGDLRAQSQLIMRGLGLSAQSQFAETATQLADLKGKVAGLLSEMGRALEKGIKLSSDPVIKDGSADRAAAFVKKVSRDLSQTVGGKTITLQDLAAQRIDELSKVLGRVETEFLLAIDYAEVLLDAQKTADLRALNDSFIKDVVNLKNSSNVQVCAGGNAGQIESGIPVLMASVNNEEFWAHLARTYSQLLLSGSRTGDVELDKIFHGTAALADGQSFQSALAMSSAQSMAAGAGGECISRVNDWAKSVLFGSGEVSVRLRNALASRQGLARLLTSGSLEAAYKGLESPAVSIEAIAKSTLLPAFGGDEAKVVSYMRSGNVATKDPGFFASASQIIHEYTTTLGQRNAVEQNLAGLTEVAKEANKDQATSQALLDSVNALKDKLARFEKLDERVNKIASGTATSFGLIAAMATRMGFSDIVDKAKAEATKLADIATADPSLFLPMGCKATSHFFNFANEGQPLQRCDSGVSTTDGNLGDNGRCRTTQTNTTTVTTNVNTHTQTTQTFATYQTYGSVRMVNTRGCWAGPGCYDQWYNMGSITSYLGATTSTSQQVTTTQSTSTTFSQAIVGVLSVPWLSPLDASAQSIMRRAAGSPFPSDRRTMIGLRIFGNAAKWRLEDPESGRRIELNAADFKVADTANGLVYEIPAAMFLAKTNGQAGFTETARITALTATGDVAIDKGVAAKTCLHSMNGGTHNVTRNVNTFSSSSSSTSNYSYGGVYYRQGYFGTRWYTSPLVLDLKPNRKLQTIAPELSNAMFDLQASGMKQRVGWIAKDTGLLALDLNGNGKIDSGRELFGDFTKLKSGSLAANGYEALADHDSNKDGVIDSQDRVFKKLVLWMDDNGDGVTQKGELKKLAQVGITGISVKYEQAAADERIQNRGNTKNNLVLFKSRFFGSNCPENGCRSYDVYFGYDDLVKPVAVK